MVSRGQTTGPQGVLLALKKVAGGDHAVKQTSSLLGGDFVFEKVLPGDYVIEASRSPWIFDVVCFFFHFQDCRLFALCMLSALCVTRIVYIL